MITKRTLLRRLISLNKPSTWENWFSGFSLTLEEPQEENVPMKFLYETSHSRMY